MQIGVHRVAMAAPNDVSEVAKLIDSGVVKPSEIVALIGKTEGNGGANDFTRGYATSSYQTLLSKHLGISPEDVGKKIAFVWSGGTEGVLSPHATVFTRSAAQGKASGGRLAMAIEVTRDILPEEVGTMAQVNEVAEADKRGKALRTRDPNGSKPYARGATALGVALGLGEAAARDVNDEAVAKRFDLFSSVASTSAGGELKNCEVLLFGNSPSATGDLRIGHAVLKDAIDADGVREALKSAGLSFNCNPTEDEAKRIVAVFAKAEASPTGAIRGRRNTMLSDADINYERHARAAVGAVIASITRDPAIFVSGGTEHQCAPGAAPIAAIVRV
jgi:cyanuric acid amidohydrolase